MGARLEVSMSDPTSQRRHAPSARSWLDRWMMIVRTIGNVNAWIIMTLFYVFILSPFGLVYRLVADPLRLRARRTGCAGWQQLPSQYDRLEDARQQS